MFAPKSTRNTRGTMSVRTPIFIVIFLAAVIGNCIQATDIASYITSLTTFVSAAADAKHTDESGFIIVDDDSDDAPDPTLAQTAIDCVQPGLLFSFSDPTKAVTAVQAKRYTVFRI